MKVVCLVPSWTELLIECGVNVVGRSRFCLHPSGKMHSIPTIGGTKDLDFVKLTDLKADLLVLDQEENLPWMKEQSPIPVHVTHVTSVESLEGEILKLAKALPLAADQLQKVAERWKTAAEKKRNWSWLVWAAKPSIFGSVYSSARCWPG